MSKQPIIEFDFTHDIKNTRRVGDVYQLYYHCDGAWAVCVEGTDTHVACQVVPSWLGVALLLFGLGGWYAKRLQARRLAKVGV